VSSLVVDVENTIHTLILKSYVNWVKFRVPNVVWTFVVVARKDSEAEVLRHAKW
jgi:hypothetical protein